MSSCNTSTRVTRAVHWFRKGLRLHDNPALLEACRARTTVPLFILDPHFATPDKIGIQRYNFLLNSLKDLDMNLRLLGSRLYVLKGNPSDVFPVLFNMWKIDMLTFETDTEPYAIARDLIIEELAHEYNIEVFKSASHTLHDLDVYREHSNSSGKLQGQELKTTYAAFIKIFSAVSSPRKPLDAPSVINENALSADDCEVVADMETRGLMCTHVPSLTDMGYSELQSPALYPGGETAALQRLRETISSRPDWVREFSKPNTSPTAVASPSTTVLSPYLKFGCVSACQVYEEVRIASAKGDKKLTETSPPVSLKGQLLWREFFYYSAYFSRGPFDQMEGNPHCKQIPWERDSEKITAWKEGRTGYPLIDAIMTQLREEGWIHHLARHAVACFLTRGTLWQHWEEGAKVFDLYLLDADYALNSANWQWLSCSRFFYQYFRVYSPVAFGKKTDKEGDFIRRYVPQLKDMPAKYIYSPWLAPLHIQKSVGCVVGVDYPERIVDHDIARVENIRKMKDAYQSSGGSNSTGQSSIKRESDKSSDSKIKRKKLT